MIDGLYIAQLHGATVNTDIQCIRCHTRKKYFYIIIQALITENTHHASNYELLTNAKNVNKQLQC